MGIATFALWTGRKQFAAIYHNLVTGEGEIDDAGEPIRYRTAAIGGILGTLGLMAFTYAMGMSWWLVIAFFAIYFAMSIGITRMRAELGPPAHDLHMAGPDSILPAIIGPGKLGTTNLVVLSLMYWFNRAYRAHPMPFQLEGFKMAEQASMNYRRLFGAMVIAVVFGAIVSFWIQLHLYYRLGATGKASWVALVFASEPYNRLDSWLNGTAPSTNNTIWAILVGLAFTLILNALRMRLPWFPFHPVGYAISSSWSMNMLWVCMFIAWLIKLLLLRYGGLRLYRAAVPFFLGIVLGECATGSIWTLIGLAIHTPTYAFWP
jgi:hypothetical protein